MKVIRQCAVCGKDFETTEFNLSRGYGKYCSKECRLQALKGNIRIHNKNIITMRIDITNYLKSKFDELYSVKYDDGTFVGYDIVAMYMELAMMSKGCNAKTEVQGTCRCNVGEPYNYCKFDRYKSNFLLDLLEKNGLIKISGEANVKTISVMRITEVSVSNKITKKDVEQ